MHGEGAFLIRATGFIFEEVTGGRVLLRLLTDEE